MPHSLSSAVCPVGIAVPSAVYHCRQQRQPPLPLDNSHDTSPGPAPVPQQPGTMQQAPSQPQPRPIQPHHTPSNSTVHAAVAMERRLGQPVRPVVSCGPPLQPAAEAVGTAVPAHLQTIRFILSDTNGMEDTRPKQPTALYAHTGMYACVCVAPLCMQCVHTHVWYVFVAPLCMQCACTRVLRSM